MTQVERSSASNGIWLCSNCSVMIDRDVPSYTETRLHSWRHGAEQRGRETQSQGNWKTADPAGSAQSPLVISIDLPIALDGSPASEVDVNMLAKRLAIHLARREPFEVLPSFACVDTVQPDDEGNYSDAMDSFELEQFKWHLRAKGGHLARSTHILFSDQARDAWSGILSTNHNWSLAFSGLVSLFRDQSCQGEKFDLWSTREQHIVGAVYLNEVDIGHVLANAGFSSLPANLIELAGIPLGGADLLPSSQQVGQAIPRIVYELGRYSSQISGPETITLKNWQLGLG